MSTYNLPDIAANICNELQKIDLCFYVPKVNSLII